MDFLTRSQKPNIGNVKTVNILFWGNAVNYQCFIKMAGQWQLHKNAMHRWIRI